jgi:predicted ribosomally synthesized peptide with SipW-like signal peptide
MNEFDISRRRLLAGLGTVGLASAGAGLGTTAYFSDEEEFTGNQLTAGSLDMKVAAEEYYSDWSADEEQFAQMAADASSTDVRLPAPANNPDAQDIAIDIIGDNYEEFVDTLATGDVVNGGIAEPASDTELCGTDKDADGATIIDIADVKPGDFGGAQFAFELCDNPGYLWLQGALESASENGLTEPESEDPDEQAGVVELLDEIQVAYGTGGIQDSTAWADTPTGFQPTNQQSLREFLNAASSDTGIELSGDIPASDGGGTGRDCFSGEGTVHQVSVIWWLPINHGNQVQTDSATFSLGFYTEQCRHNDGSGMPPEQTPTGTPTNTPTSTPAPGTEVTVQGVPDQNDDIGATIEEVEVTFSTSFGSVVGTNWSVGPSGTEQFSINGNTVRLEYPNNSIQYSTDTFLELTVGGVTSTGTADFVFEPDDDSQVDSTDNY